MRKDSMMHRSEAHTREAHTFTMVHRSSPMDSMGVSEAHIRGIKKSRHYGYPFQRLIYLMGIAQKKIAFVGNVLIDVFIEKSKYVPRYQLTDFNQFKPMIFLCFPMISQDLLCVGNISCCRKPEARG